jgi:hypothetical protein
MWAGYGAGGPGHLGKHILRHAVAAASAVALAGSVTSVAANAKASTAASAPASRPSAAPTRAASAAPASPTVLPAGRQGSAASIPWSQVGPGWLLGEWSPKLRNSSVTLVLVDPLGGRYVLASGRAVPAGGLVAWSGDGRRALFAGGDGNNTLLTVVQLRSGKSNTFSIGSGSSGPVAFTEPDGRAIVVGGTAFGTATPTPVYTPLRRFGLQGALEYTYPESFPQAGHVQGEFLYSPDGRELVLPTTRGFEVVTNEGQPVRYLPMSPVAQGCQPMRWWAAGVVLASCGGLLWLVPTSGGAPTSLTLKGSPGDGGDVDAWSLPSGVYLQDLGACGYVYLAKLGPKGHTMPVTVPGAVGSVFVLGAYGDQLALTSQFACQAGSSSLFWFNPATRAVTPLLGPSANGGTAGTVILFGQPWVWSDLIS